MPQIFGQTEIEGVSGRFITDLPLSNNQMSKTALRPWAVSMFTRLNGNVSGLQICFKPHSLIEVAEIYFKKCLKFRIIKVSTIQVQPH